jgi:hypothetical protein
METINIQVSSKIAQLYRDISPEQQAEIKILVTMLIAKQKTLPDIIQNILQESEARDANLWALEFINNNKEDLSTTLPGDNLNPSHLSKTVLERMGGVPKHLLSDGNLSDRDRRRTLIANHLQQKNKRDS